MIEEREEVLFIQKSGFTKVQNMMTLDPNLSDGAFRTYVLYLYYVQLGYWPGTEQLIKDRDKSRNAIAVHNREFFP